MLNVFLRKLAKELRQFVTQQIVIGLAVALIISLNQFRTGQLSASGLRTDLWRVALPYLLIIVIAILYHAVRTSYLMIKDLTPSQPSSVILTDTESEAEGRSQVNWIVACLVLVLLGLLGFSLSNRLRPRHPLAPTTAPTITGGSVEYDWEAGEQKGRLSQAPLFSPCFERGAKVYSLNDLSSFPGGPNSKRPWLVFTPTHYSLNYLLAQPDYYDLMFEISLVNRGEASIAKDWSLCILQGGQPHRFTAQRYSSDTKAVFGDRKSVRDITFSNPVEHGHAMSGWLLFRVQKEFMDKNGTSVGSLQCKDYLDHKSSVSFGFGFAPGQIGQTPSQPSKGLGAVAQ